MISFMFTSGKQLGVTYTRKTRAAAIRLARKLLGKDPHVDHRDWFAKSAKGCISHVRGILLQDLFPVDPKVLEPVQKKIDRLTAQSTRNDDRIRQLLERRYTLSQKLAKLGMDRQSAIIEAQYHPEKGGFLDVGHRPKRGIK